MADYLLPDVGEGLTEAEIVTWKVKPGDTIAVNDVVVEIETAKSLVELPSPYAGTVEALLVNEGETVPVGTPIIRITEVGAEVSKGSTTGDGPETSAAPTDGEEPMQTLVGYGPREASARRRARRGGASPRTEAGANTLMQVQGAFSPGGAMSEPVVDADEPPVPAEPAQVAGSVRVLAKPPVRKLAKDLGVDLRSLRPSGPNGTVSRADVEQAAQSVVEVRSAAEPRNHQGDGEREWREPIKGVRKMMAQAMVQSAFTAPHVTEWVSVDVTRTTELVARLRERPEFRDVKVSPLLIVAMACLRAIRRTPVVNSVWDEEAQEVVFRRFVNLGIAAATPRGLVVPNVKDADRLSLPELAKALTELATTAREGKTQPAEMSGGTFTITNVGVFGVDGGTPIINPGESAILCFGATRKQPWVVGDQVVPRDVCTLTLSFDHRHIDGESGSRFLADVAAILEDPATALLF